MNEQIKQFEYSFDDVKTSIFERALLLADRGRDGWELVSVLDGEYKHTFYWKRQVLKATN